MTLLTVGHGTLAAEELAALLTDAGVARLVDIRRFPTSRRHPQFAGERMQDWLAEHGITYRWEERLGGRRSRRADSPNTALRNPGFQGYADYMGEPAFRAALDGLLADAEAAPTAMLCAESVWWRCHRRLVADAAVLLCGVTVWHLFHDGRLAEHPVTEVARRSGDVVVYGDPQLWAR